ncbi:MAG: class I SAM-dependent methyltransferase [Patescibacteria group bacterium]|jgi:SAM-dependent methyltransferase
MKNEVAENLLNLVKRNYKEIAAEFDATRKKEIWPEIKNLVADIRDGDKILDVGCGNGRLLETLKDKNISYLGVDNSEELIKIARQNYPDYKFLVGDILSLQTITKDSFDYIFCVAVLPHIPSKKLQIQALEELRGRLNLGGVIILSVWNLWNRAVGKEKYRRLIFKNGLLKLSGRNKLDLGDLVFPWKNAAGVAVSDRYYHAFTKLELKDLAKKTGLSVKKIKKDKFNYWLILQ